MSWRSLWTISCGLFLVFGALAIVHADDKPTDSAETAEKPAEEGTTAAGETPASKPESKPSSGSPSSGPQKPPHDVVLKEAEPVKGMIPMWRKGNNLFVELNGSHYNSEYIILISIAKGIGQGTLLGGYSWSFGDDWVWQFRKIEDQVYIIRRNVRFRASEGGPEGMAVQNAYTDSVLFSLPIITKGPSGGDLIDLSSVFMSDLPQISRFLPGFAFASNKSTWAEVKGFENNVELEVAATYASSGMVEIDSVPDSRGATINVHYSISKLPQTGYQPRIADDRVGYFLTVQKDYSKKSDRDQFVRYINRWHLEKPQGAGDGPTPPKQPIIFWIEKTVPHQYRAAVRAGIEEWNEAFETAGWVNAIEVRQQPDNADWDPEDINYNTFRWITSSAGFAMGPSRVNPYTGQILDADIIFDADFLQYWKEEYETLTAESIAQMTGGPLDYESYQKPDLNEMFAVPPQHRACRLQTGMSRQLAFGAAALMSTSDPKVSEELKERMILEGLKEVVMHEVGHTLGLRHNFKASTYLNLEDLNNPDKAKAGTVASVMDYNPTNIVPKGKKQGPFYTSTIGPYDKWAITYGYKPFSGGTKGEVGELKKIAARSSEPALAYATDEDVRGIDPDPLANRFDLGSDSLEYAKQRASLVKEIMPSLVDRVTKDGDDYTQARRAFNILLSQYGQGMYFAARYVGGMHTSRSHKGDKESGAPFKPVEIKRQREALALLEDGVFSDKPFQFPPELYNYLAASNWSHWGTSNALRKDFPVHDVISMWQERILYQLLSPVTLTRIHDMELSIPADEEALTAAELIERLTAAIFAEVDEMPEGEFSNRKPAISSLRRNLQRVYLSELSNLAMGRTSAPDDCQTVAYAQLSDLKQRMEKALEGDGELDAYSRAHLQESASRIEKVLDARFTLTSP